MFGMEEKVYLFKVVREYLTIGDVEAGFWRKHPKFLKSFRKALSKFELFPDKKQKAAWTLK